MLFTYFLTILNKIEKKASQVNLFLKILCHLYFLTILNKIEKKHYKNNAKIVQKLCNTQCFKKFDII